MRKTLVLSVVLHLLVFSTALLWSAQYLKDGGGKPGENVLFVRLLDEKRLGTGEEANVSGKRESTERNRVLTNTEQPDLERFLVTSEKTARIFHDPELPLEYNPGVENDDSENAGADASEAAEPVSAYVDIAFGADVEEKSSVHGGHDAESSRNNAFVRSGGHEDGNGAGMTGGPVPANIVDAIRNAIERVKTYPLAARRRGTEGVVHVGFRIMPDGEPEDVRIVRSSGSRLLDMTTLDIVKRAAPFPYIESPLELPVVFRLD